MSSIQLDTDGDGQLTFDEFKVLFANADKRKKNSQKKIDMEGQQPTKVMETTEIDQEVTQICYRVQKAPLQIREAKHLKRKAFQQTSGN